MTPGESSLAGRSLLATKLHAPRRRPGVVQRQRLGTRLVAADATSVTLVSAPAGFGKTTLLVEWFGARDDEGSATPWLSLDAGDNDPAVFWTYVIAAIQRASPHVGTSALAALQSSQPLTSVVAALLNDLYDLADRVVVVLDDYHVIESAEIHESIAYLIDHAPPSFHLVLASRSDPPFPLARLRARGQLSEIRPRTSDSPTTRRRRTSTTRWVCTSPPAPSTPSVPAPRDGSLRSNSRALWLQGRDDVDRFIENFTGDDRFVVDYLVEEVLDRQPAAIRSFLLQTSVLDRLTGGLCDAVTSGAAGRATLEQLDRSNLFLVALDDRRIWYRYHHLFADVLRARLTHEDPDLIDEFHRRASHWYATNGEPAAAVEHRWPVTTSTMPHETDRARRPHVASEPSRRHPPTLAGSAARRGLRRPARARHLLRGSAHVHG